MRISQSAIRFFILLFAITCTPDDAFADEIQERVASANHLYAEQKYEEAVAAYESVLESGFDNGYLHYNLGNACYRAGKIGKAVLHFLKAQKRLPREEKVEANLLFALQKTVDQTDWQFPNAWAALFFWLEDVTLEEHIGTLIGVNLVLWLAWSVLILHPSYATRLARNMALGLFGLVLVSALARFAYDAGHRYAVVLAKDIAVHAEKGSEKPVLFRLHEGAIGKIVEEEGGWYRLTLPDESGGWVRAEDDQVGT